MSTDPRAQKLAELEQLRARAAELERELSSPAQRWQGGGYYTMYYATAGFFLGMFAAMASLLFNIVGSLLVGQQPLKLIQVYLTFPLGERAMSPDFDNNLALAIGCCLYVATGMALGVPFHLALTRLAAGAPLASRLAYASAIGVALWLFNFYAVLSWLQPLLFGGAWIVTEIPWWVGLLTHLVFGWTMALLYPLGLHEPYRLQTE